MSEEIVACPGCDKKFRIPEGAPAGSFDCTACGAEVAYGADAAAAAGGGGRRRAKAGSRAKGKAKGRGKPHASSAKKREARSRRQEAESGALSVEEKRKHKSANTWGIVAVVMGILGVLIIIILAVRPKDKPKPVAKQGTASAYSTGSLSSEGGEEDTTGGTMTPTVDPGGTDTAGAGDVQAPTGTTPDTDDDDDDDTGGIGGVADDGQMTSSQIYRGPADEIFISYPDLDSTSEEDSAALRQDVALLVDRDTGIDGTRAQNRLEKAGKKAIPALLSAWQGKTFETGEEQWGLDMVQRVLRAIAKDDGPSSPFVARFVPQEPIDPGKFDRAGRMWIAWWITEGQRKDEFKWADEDEE